MRVNIKSACLFWGLFVVLLERISAVNSSSYTLGSNIVVNSNISTPSISPSSYYYYLKTKGGWATTGTYVEYNIPNKLPKLLLVGICPTFYGVTND